MRRSLIIAIAVSASAAVAGVAIATAAQASPGRGHDSVQRLTVVEHAVTDTTVDLAPTGDSRGDQLAFANPIYDAKDKVREGSDLGSCVRTEPGVSWQCAWTLTLPQGSLTVQGPFLDAGDSTLAITGGTGAFATARGEMGLHALDQAGTKYLFSYRISR